MNTGNGEIQMWLFLMIIREASALDRRPEQIQNPVLRGRVTNGSVSPSTKQTKKVNEDIEEQNQQRDSN